MIGVIFVTNYHSTGALRSVHCLSTGNPSWRMLFWEVVGVIWVPGYWYEPLRSCQWLARCFESSCQIAHSSSLWGRHNLLWLVWSEVVHLLGCCTNVKMKWLWITKSLNEMLSLRNALKKTTNIFWGGLHNYIACQKDPKLLTTIRPWHPTTICSITICHTTSMNVKEYQLWVLLLHNIEVNYLSCVVGEG